MIRRVAYLSMHTSPLLQPGSGYAGGMNVYIDELARVMAGRDIEVVVYTRRVDPDEPEVVAVSPGYQVVNVTAGQESPLPMTEMPSTVAEFAEGVLKHAYASGQGFDLVHSHYWLSGWAGVLVKEALDLPLANSFHTLGRIKDLTKRRDEPSSSPMRLLTEEQVIARSDCVIASTPFEFEDLLEHYGAIPERLCTSPPGVDHSIFRPGDRAAARRWLGLPGGPIVLFAGRIQPLKGVDIAIEAIAQTISPSGPSPTLLIVGGPSGPGSDDEIASLDALAQRLGVAARVHRVPPQPHDQLAAFYQASDVLVMPSRSETFGLVAAEAQACGLPVVASAVGGLPYVVSHGRSGILVDGHDPADYARALAAVIYDRSTAERLGQGAIEHAEQFSWPATADRLLELYRGITGQ